MQQEDPLNQDSIVKSSNTHGPLLKRILSFRGYISRGEYWAAVGISVLIYMFNFLVSSSTEPVIVLLTFPGIVAFIWVFWGASVARLRDMGQTPWLVFLYIVPFAGIFMVIWLGSSKSISDVE